ncbi:hypothetical protein AHAS_Ahas12G0134700 [Arachis hypogaea]
MLTHSNPPPEATAALMMITNTASYVPKQFLALSFSLDFTDSSQEETLTQEGQPGSQKGKSLETSILIEELEELVEKIVNTGVKAAMDFAEGKSPPLEKQPADQIFEKFETPARRKEFSVEMKEKCYLWATHVKTYGDGTTNEYEPMCTLNAQQPLVLSKIHFTYLKASSYIEVEIVTAMCLILNKQNIKRFEEEIYCFPSNIMIFAPVCFAEHWWIWVADVRKKKFCILNPFHKKCPSKPRMKLNNFVGYVISRMRVYAGGAPLKKDDREIELPYINISGKKINYDCAIYAEVDHFRVEYASCILFHEMNRDRDTGIRESEAIRLSKPSAVLLSPYCQIESDDIDSD